MSVKGQHIRKGEDIKKWQKNRENIDFSNRKPLTEYEPREIIDTETQKTTSNKENS